MTFKARAAEFLPRSVPSFRLPDQKLQRVGVIPHLEQEPRVAEVLPHPKARVKVEPRGAEFFQAPGVKLRFTVHRLHHMVSINLKIRVLHLAEILWVIHFRIRNREGP